MIWDALTEQHEGLRADASPAGLKLALRTRLEKLHRFNRLVDPQAPWRLTQHEINAPRRWELVLSSKTTGLKGMEALEDGAALLIQALGEVKPARLLQYTLAIEGTVRGGGATWLAAVHLDPEPRGGGPCGHALLHAHVGPNYEAPPKVRVPLPPLAAPDALDWLLTLVYPDWEPGPWA